MLRRGARHDAVESLRSVLSNPMVSNTLRDYFQAQHGAEYLEFLIACSQFDKTTNPFQRFRLLHVIMHRFVRDNAERCVRLSDRCRVALLRDWDQWSEGNRIPAGVRLAALEAAAVEIHDVALSQGVMARCSPTSMSQWRRFMSF